MVAWESSGAILGKGVMLRATLPAAWKWETGHGDRCRQLLWLLVNQGKDFSPLCSEEPQGQGVPDTPTLSRRPGLPGQLPTTCTGLRLGRDIQPGEGLTPDTPQTEEQPGSGV